MNVSLSKTIADINVHCGISIIVPTYQECENIPFLLEAIAAVKKTHGMTLEVLFMDDNSRDGSVEAVQNAGFDWARMIVRTERPGLSEAVIDGFKAAQYPILVCMDCDLSHPPEKIPQMVLGLATGQQFVIGSRYVPGGSTDDDWGVLRWINSLAATALARPLTKVRDPMSGFFALRKSDFEAAQDLNPVGYKIGLELIVKGDLDNVGEVPIHFTDRVRGQSKLSLKEQLKYVQHVRRLYLHRFANAMHLLQFLAVGLSGLFVNLLVLSMMLMVGFAEHICVIGGIVVSILSNFLLNRRFTFSYARERNMGKQFVGFLGASMVGLLVNYAVTLFMRDAVFTQGAFALQFSAMVGVLAGMTFNFLGNRYIVFRKRFIRSEQTD